MHEISIKFKYLNLYKSIILINILLWLLIIFDYIYIDINLTFLRPLVGFIFLTFPLGFLLLKTLKIEFENLFEKFFVIIGLSIGFVMFLGFFMNFLSPIMGFNSPISSMSLLITISAIQILLSFIIDKERNDRLSLNFKLSQDHFYEIILIIFIPLLLAIDGSILMNNYRMNYLFFIMIFLIISVILLIGFNSEFIKKDIYLFIIWIFSLSLLFHRSLISRYLWGYDIFTEYNIANMVVQNSIWNPNISSNVNSVLSITMLAPFYSLLLNVDLTIVFKVIYPLLFSFVPTILYIIYRRQMDEKIAFFSCIFFISVNTFYSEMLQLARQEIAELFFVLLLLMIVIGKDSIKFSKYQVILFFFGFSLIVSHYGLSDIALYLFIVAFLISFFLFLKSEKIINISTFSEKINTIVKDIKISSFSNISLGFIFGYAIFLFIWQISISNASSLYSLYRVFENIIMYFTSDFLNPKSVEGIYMIIRTPISNIDFITKILHIITQVFIIIGILIIFITKKNPSFIKDTIKFQKDFLNLSIAALSICLAALILPYFSSSLNTSRIFQIGLILLAPFCIIGGLFIFDLFLKFLSKSKIGGLTKLWKPKSFKLLLILFIVYLIFCISVLSEISRNSLSLSFYQISFILLTPFIIICGWYVFDLFLEPHSKSIIVRLTKLWKPKSFTLLSIFLIIYFLFNMGVVSEIVNAPSTSISFDPYFDFPHFNEQDFTGAEWIYYTKSNHSIYADEYRSLLLKSFDLNSTISFSDMINKSYPFYIYTGSFNIKNNEVLVYNWTGIGQAHTKEYFPLNPIIINKNKIYSNDNVIIYY